MYSSGFNGHFKKKSIYDHLRGEPQNEAEGNSRHSYNPTYLHKHCNTTVCTLYMYILYIYNIYFTSGVCTPR